MPIIFKPIPLTEAQVNDVVVMSLTGEQHEMLEYDDVTHIINDGMGAVGYACESGFIGVSELGVVYVFDSLGDLLSNWSMLK